MINYKKWIFLSLFMMIQLLWAGSKQQKHFYDMTNRQIGDLIRQTSETKMTITEKMNKLSQYFLGTPYNFKCVGDGPYALQETYPLVNFKQTNCMALCEHVLALSISDSWDNFFDNLQQIRYKDGLIGMRTRNHYTMADWLPQNSWLLEDASGKVGGKYTKTVTRTISHIKFFKNKGLKDMRYVLPDRTITIDYVPVEALAKVKDKIQTGDVLALIYADKKGIFSAHMMLIADKNGQKFIREATLSKMTTVDTPYDKWIAAKRIHSGRYLGLAFMRIKDALNQPGKIILPWNIPELKKIDQKENKRQSNR